MEVMEPSCADPAVADIDVDEVISLESTILAVECGPPGETGGDDDGYQDEDEDGETASTASTMSDTSSPPLSSSPPLRSPSPTSLSYYVWDRKDRRSRSLRNFAGLTLFSKR